MEPQADDSGPGIVDAEGGESDAEAASSKATKRPRKRGAEKLEADLVIQRRKAAVLNVKISSLAARVYLKPAQRKALDKAQSEWKMTQALIENKTDLLETARRLEEAKAAADAAKVQVATDAARANAYLSDAGVCALVELVMAKMGRLTNRTDTVDKVWKHIHDSFMQQVLMGLLPDGDGRPEKALRARYARAPPAHARDPPPVA